MGSRTRHVTPNSNGDGTIDQRRRLLLVGPVLVAAALFLPSIGARLIYLGDEARYALLARNMVQTGDWLVPRIGGEVHMEKTPLFMWAIAALSLAGREVTERTAVLPAALSAIGGVAVTACLGRRLFGPRAGLLAAFALTTSFGYFWHARMAFADMMVTFFTVAAALAFWTAVAGPSVRRLPMALCWACLGLGLAAKGPLGLLPLLPFGAFLVVDEGWSGLRRLRPLTGVAVLVVISLPWALGFALQRETSYVQSVLIEDFLLPRARGWGRFSDLVFAIGPITVGMLPWTPFLPAAAWRGWWTERDEVRRAFRFLVVWVLAYVVVVTVLPHKRDRYLLSAYPALALMIGWLWDRWAARPSPGAVRGHAWVWAGVSAAMAVAVLAPLRPRPELAVLVPPTLAEKLPLVALLLVSAGLAVAAGRAGRPLAVFAAVCVPLALALAYETKIFVAAHNRAYDVKALSQRLAARAGPEAEILTYRYQSLALQFYAGRTVRRARNVGEVMEVVSAGRPVYVVAEDRSWPDLVDVSRGAWTIVDHADVDGRSVSVRSPAARP